MTNSNCYNKVMETTTLTATEEKRYSTLVMLVGRGISLPATQQAEFDRLADKVAKAVLR